MTTELTPKQKEALKNLRALLDRVDAETRLPDEPPLRSAIADRARRELAGGTP